MSTCNLEFPRETGNGNFVIFAGMIGPALKLWRDQVGMNQSDLASELEVIAGVENISQSQISRVENAELGIGIVRWLDWSTALDVHPVSVLELAILLASVPAADARRGVEPLIACIPKRAPLQASLQESIVRNLGPSLALWRGFRRMKQRDLAEVLSGVLGRDRLLDGTYISHVERGVAEISMDRWLAWCEALSVNPCKVLLHAIFFAENEGRPKVELVHEAIADLRSQNGNRELICVPN